MVCRGVVVVVCAVVAAVLVRIEAQAACDASSEPTLVCTTRGAVRGVIDGDLIAFRGIPYALPPAGARRWMPPAPAQAWRGIRDASRFGPVCPQLAGSGVIGDEDCLTLNVQRPRRGGAPLPVMVYFTGGGNHSQSGQGTAAVFFNGAKLAGHGILLVTVNIRLGALGFLSHAALDENGRVSGNYGNQDQIAVLRWVKDEIAAFGGDPGRVLVFGTSAGGANICGLLVSPLAAGLFHAAAMQSSVPTGCEFKTAAQARADSGARLVAALGCETAPDIPGCLRARSPAELVRAIPAVTNLFPRTYGPIVDGLVFPDQPLSLIEAGRVARVPVIIGNTLEETAGWSDTAGAVEDGASYRRALESIFGAALGPAVEAQYPLARFPSARTAFVRATTDGLFTCASRRVARMLVTAGAGPVFRYLFTHRYDNNPGPVDHTNEMPMLFFSWRTYTPGQGDAEVSGQMLRYWTELAKTGTPNGRGGIEWAAVTTTTWPYLDLNVTPSMSSDADSSCDFWDRAELPSPHL